MGTRAYLRSYYFVFWLLALAAIGAGVWWQVFDATPPAPLGPVNASAVKTEAVESQEDKLASTRPASERPEPKDAQLSLAELTLTSSDGKTVVDVQAHQAEKHAKRYTLKEGTISFRNGDNTQLKLTITDATYEIFPGATPRPGPPSPDGAAASASNDAYVTIEGSMHGEVSGTGQSFDAKRLRWDEKTNVAQAEAVTYFSPRIQVSGQTMRITLPSGQVDFDGPVTAKITGELSGK